MVKEDAAWRLVLSPAMLKGTAAVAGGASPQKKTERQGGAVSRLIKSLF
jgi:hypothetical protein